MAYLLDDGPIIPALFVAGQLHVDEYQADLLVTEYQQSERVGVRCVHLLGLRDAACPDDVEVEEEAIGGLLQLQ